MADSICANPFIFNEGLTEENSFTHLIKSISPDTKNEIELIEHSNYYTDDEFVNNIQIRESKIKMLSLNYQSINAKIEKLKAFLAVINEYTEISIICLQETWGHENVDMSFYNLPNYSMVYENRRLSAHGGLLIYIHNDFSYTKLNLENRITETSNVFESLVIEVWRKNCKYNKFVIGSIYRIPSYSTSDLNTFTEEFITLLNALRNKSKFVYLCGDYNIDLLKIHRNNPTNYFYESSIAELFSKKYNELYNSVSYEEQEMNDLMSVNKKDVEIFCVNSIDDTLYKHTHKISLAEVQAAVQKLKVGKSDCVDGFVSDNLKKGTECLYEIIALLFSTMLTHGVAPAGLLLSTLVPIPKNKRENKSDSNNYRQIAISSLLGKLFVIIILEEQHHGLITDELQFGFKKNASTVLCTSLLMETVEYYNENDTDCYLLLLDASKAFDRVEYVKLFTTLRNRKICPIVLRLLMNMYINQQIQVKWNNMISPTCTISNGVKQGGCMSPTLFSIYLDKLLGILRASNVGCRYGNHYMGAFCYADDISLLSPTVSGLQDILKICERYADKYKIHFNASKSQLLCFNTSTCTKSKDIKVYMRDGSVIQYLDTCTHLGNILCTSDKHVMIDSAVKDLNCRLNNLLADFSHCNSDTLSTLFNSYCMNVYGCQLWKFNGKHINTFFTAWRKAIRRIWKIPFRSHNKLVHLINGSHYISIILEKRCIKQSWKMLNSEYELYNKIVKYSMHNANSTLGENVRYFMYKYNLTLDDWNQNINNISKKVDMYVNNHADRAVECVAIAIRELCDMRDSDDAQVFSDSELKFMIDMLCTK